LLFFFFDGDAHPQCVCLTGSQADEHRARPPFSLRRSPENVRQSCRRQPIPSIASSSSLVREIPPTTSKM
jgi:hypothetical protein